MGCKFSPFISYGVTTFVNDCKLCIIACINHVSEEIFSFYRKFDPTIKIVKWARRIFSPKSLRTVVSILWHNAKKARENSFFAIFLQKLAPPLKFLVCPCSLEWNERIKIKIEKTFLKISESQGWTSSLLFAISKSTYILVAENLI